MPTIYDHRGEPVSTSDLKREHAAAHITSVRSPYRESVASTLTPARLARLLKDADNGDPEAFLTLADEMEERELHYRAVLGTRKLSVTGRPVSVEAAGESAKDVEIANAVRDVVEAPIFESLLFDLLDGLGKGYSVVETLWDTTGKRWIPKGYVHREARFFRYDRDTQSMLRLLDESDPVEGIPLAPFKYVVHTPKLKTGLPLRAGLARVACAAYMLKSFTLRDWHAFMEVFGMPLRLGKYGPDATDDEKATLLRAVANIAFDAAAIVPEDMVIEFIEASKASGGPTLFQGAANWWDKQVSKVVLGQTMTTDDGASLAQAKVHGETKDDIRNADARQLTATVNRDLIRPFVDLNWGPQERYPSIRIQTDDPEDLEALSGVVDKMSKHIAIPVWWVREKFGFPEPEEGEETIGGEPPAPPPPPPGAPVPPPPQPPAEPGDEPPPEPPAPEPAANRARNRASDEDAIDELAQQALADWQPLLDGNVGALIRLAQQAGDFDQFRQLLERAAESDAIDIDEVTEKLAAATFKARGLGDATDSVT